MVVSKKLLDRLRAAFKRYGTEVLGDPDITIHFFPSELETHLRVHLGSPKFQNMGWSECHDSIRGYLQCDPEITSEDLFNISSIATAPEAVEFV